MIATNSPRNVLTIFAALAAMVAGTAAANASRVEGTYIYTLTERCQSVVRHNRTNNRQPSIDSIFLFNGATIAEEIGTIKFTTTDGGKTGLLTINGRGYEGRTILFNDGSRIRGKLKSLRARGRNVPFEATGNSVTLGDGANTETYLAVFGRRDPNGVAQSINLLRKYDDYCVRKISLTR